MSAGPTPGYRCTHGLGYKCAKCYAQPGTMPVETATGPEQRRIEAVHIDQQHGRRIEPELRPGEEAFHSIDGRCTVIKT